MRNRSLIISLFAILVLSLGLAAGLAAAQAPADDAGPSNAEPAAVEALGTGFTYQGQLIRDGRPYNGECAFLFGLWSDPVTGDRPIATYEQSHVTVTGGLFTVPGVDFGNTAFSGDPRWLAVGVKCDLEISYTTITPRQALTATPYALYALRSAGNWSLTGNAGTSPGTNYLGTSDDQALELKVNADRALRIEPNATSPNLIGGSSANLSGDGVEGATVAGGGNATNDCGGFVGDYSCRNTAMASYATVGGGRGNEATAVGASIGGEHSNLASGLYATVAGGNSNSAAADYATVAGGGRSEPAYPATANRVTDDYGTVGGGGNNQAGDGDADITNSTFATVGGGHSNTASNTYATAGGGHGNEASHIGATVGGGYDNTASGQGATVGGGNYSTASGFLATVGGGMNNAARVDAATVGGGYFNTVDGTYGTVAGGHTNRVTDNYSTVGGGENNLAGDASANPTNAMHATVGGGLDNQASAGKATVAGGQSNSASALAATVGGGYNNAASGTYATVPGGQEARAGDYGQQAYASGSFASTGDAQASLFVLRAETSDDEPTHLYLGGTGYEEITRRSGRAMAVDILLVARSEGGAAAAWRIVGIINDVSTHLKAESLGYDVGATGWAYAWMDLTADTFTVVVSGQDGVNIRWVASVRTAEVAW